MKKALCLFITLSTILFVCCCLVGVEGSFNYVDDEGSLGAQNAVKKAHQMTDLEFIPSDTLYANKRKTYYPNISYKGLVYSSVLETNTFVGIDVSFHTFMTALRNPKSVLYTENINRPPYHGNLMGKGAYYGTVCSGFVSYALGFTVYQTTYDLSESDLMTLVEDQSAKGIQLADVLWQKGHVALITGIRRKKSNGEIVRIEISEAWRTGCRRRVVDGESDFNKMLSDGLWKIYRYKNLEKNKYEPLTEFVAVDGEKLRHFRYNSTLCPNKGDKSCYISGEVVVLNVTGDYDKLEIFKDSKPYKQVLLTTDTDIVLKELPYGDYKARLTKGWKKSDCSYWKVVDVHVNANESENIVSFHSENAIPIYLEFCTITGSRPVWAWYELTEKDIENGYVNIAALPLSDRLKKKKSDMYAKVHFECDYGRVVNNPILWNKKSTIIN